MDDSSRLAGLPTCSKLSTCTVDVDSGADEVVVSLSGDLDMADADQVGDLLVKAVEAGRPAVRVRLTDLTFADSSAIKAILIGAKAADERGVAYELVNPRGAVQRLLEVTGLTTALTVVHEPEGELSSNSLS
ncbi:MAG: STAS domain-containing protein [Ilumatobacteraceae bacterium]